MALDQRQTIIILGLAGGVAYALYRANRASPVAAAPLAPAPTYVAKPVLATSGSSAMAQIRAPLPAEGASSAAEWFARTPVRDLAATTAYLRNLMYAAVSKYAKPADYFIASATTKLTTLGVPTLIVMGARTAAALAGPLAPAAGQAG